MQRIAYYPVEVLNMAFISIVNPRLRNLRLFRNIFTIYIVLLNSLRAKTKLLRR